MIGFGICSGPTGKIEKFAKPGIRCTGEQEPICAVIIDATSIFGAYNKILDSMLEHDDVEAVVLIHDDLTICDWEFPSKIRRALDYPDVAIVGVIGARDVTALGFLPGTYSKMLGRCMETRSRLDFGGGTHQVDVVDGSFMAFSRWAMENLRFDTQMFNGFHGYDFDICMQARAAGKSVIVTDIDVFHHCDADRNNRILDGTDVGFAVADATWRAKWGFPTRPPVTVVILAWNAWEATRRCLDSLHPTLESDDQVVVVDNGSRDHTADGLRGYPWVEVLTNPENRGFAAGCNQGAAQATREIIVFLNNDTVTPGGWLDDLVGGLSDLSIGATGPRSNFVSGPQLVEVNFDTGDGPEVCIAQMMAFASTYQAANRNRFTDVTRLVGFCLAVRRSLFEEIGGFDEAFGTGGFEDDDLCLRIVDAGQRLVIAHGSFVYHEGHSTFDANGLDWYGEQSKNAPLYLAKHRRVSLEDVPPPGSSVPPLVSACMIVRDEASALDACLGSIRGFVDEVVVYDTGSKDSTREIASGSGATVIEGYWDDDFARARNDSLARCSGDWILWVDADESLVADDPSRTRAKLWWVSRIARPDQVQVDGFSIRIENLLLDDDDDASVTVHRAVRLFRRDRCEWDGRVHEQITPRVADDSGALLAVADLDDLHIVHRGYLATDRGALRSKAARNLRAAEAEVAGMNGSERATESDAGWVYSQLARSLWASGRPDEALDSARQAVFLAIRPDSHRAALTCATQIALFSGEVEEARGYFDQLDRLDRDGAPGQDWGWLPPHLVRLLLELSAAEDPGVVPEDLQLRAMALSPAEKKLLVAQSLNVPPEVGDRLLEGCHGMWPGNLAVLACASRVAESVTVDRSRVWADRMRLAAS